MKSNLAEDNKIANPDRLILAAKSGVDAALDRLIELLASQLWAELGQRRLRGMSPSRSMSDLIQETLIRAREQFEKFDRTTFTEFKYWARGILYLRHKHLMRQHRSRFDERTRRKIWLAVAFRKNLPSAERPELAIEDKLEGREEAARAFAAFQRLKPHEQFIINLRVVEGLPFAQIAALVNSTEGAVTKACGRALKRLRGLFESHETT